MILDNIQKYLVQYETQILCHQKLRPSHMVSVSKYCTFCKLGRKVVPGRKMATKYEWYSNSHLKTLGNCLPKQKLIKKSEACPIIYESITSFL